MTKSAITRILDYKNNPRKEDERPSLESLFETEEGKRFGSQVESAADFAKRGLTLSIILPVAGSLAKRASHGIARGDLDGLVTEETPQDEREKFNAIKFLMKDLTSQDTEDPEELLYVREDVLWFLSLVTFSLHTYLDVYSRSIIERIDCTPSLRTRVEEYLKKKPEKLTDSLGRPIQRTAEVKRVGVLRRLTIIEEGLGLEEILGSLIEPEYEDLDAVLEEFLVFIPDSLTRPFTNADLAKAIDKPRWLVQKMIYC